MNRKRAQTAIVSRPRQVKQQSVSQPLRSVWQDNPTPPRDRTATRQPAPRKNNTRPRPLHTKTTRVPFQNEHRGSTVHLTLWVKPRVKTELKRIAELEGISVSATGAALLEQILQQNITTQHGALLETIINKAIAKQMRSYSTRLAVLLVRVAYASEQTRSLVTNLLGRQHGITPEILAAILDGSSKAAKGKITYKSPQLANIISEVEHWFTELETASNEQ